MTQTNSEAGCSMELQHHYAMVSFPSQDMANSTIPRRQAHKLNLKPCFVEFSQVEFEVLHVALLTHQTSHRCIDAS